MEYPSGRHEHFRHLLFYEYIQGKTAAAAAPAICSGYGDNCIGETTALTWFTDFRNGILDVVDAPNLGRTSEVDQDRLEAILKTDGQQTLRESADKMGCSHESVRRHLLLMGHKQRSGSWVRQ